MGTEESGGRWDWRGVAEALDERGHARLPGLLRAGQCRELVAIYEERERFRSFVDLAQHRFGEGGDYRYFANPLPPAVRALRRDLYSPLAAIANEWQERLGEEDRYPRTLGAFLRRCHERGQDKPTPLLLRYREGGYNCLHQDLYGELSFPLQVAILLSRPEQDFEGAEFLLAEQRPRQQVRVEAIRLTRGEGLVFPNSVRPVEGRRGWLRARVRHGVSRLHSGHRLTLGIIFHDAR